MWQNLKSVVGIKSQPLFELVPRFMLLVLSAGFHSLVRKISFSFERLEDSHNLTLSYDLFLTRDSVSEGLLM